MDARDDALVRGGRVHPTRRDASARDRALSQPSAARQVEPTRERRPGTGTASVDARARNPSRSTRSSRDRLRPAAPARPCRDGRRAARRAAGRHPRRARARLGRRARRDDPRRRGCAHRDALRAQPERRHQSFARRALEPRGCRARGRSSHRGAR